MISLLLLLLTSFFSTEAAPAEDLVESLPFFGKTPTPHYSGYLDATEGCNTEVNGAYCHIHYWLALAEGDDWESKPLVLWLNGGPGSSSILGFLQELGPLLLNNTGGFMENPYAWTKVASVMAIESPIGVGFSYCETQVKGRGLCQNTDKYTASASRAALVDFFTNKFPEFQSHDFFITGESYAGIYIPTLAYEILSYNGQNPEVLVPLKGLAIGDPCTDNEAQQFSMDSLWYGHKYGLVDDAIFDVLWNKCGARFPSIMTKNNQRQDNTWTNMHRHLQSDDPECQLAMRKFLLSSSRALSQGWPKQYIDDYSLFAPVSFDEDNAMADYLNRPNVQAALHVRSDLGSSTWPSPAGGFDYTKEYNACNDEVTDPRSMIDFYRKIVPELERVWVYNGDTDPCVSYEGTRTAIKRVGLAELDGGGYRPWFFNNTAASLKVLKEKSLLFGPNLQLQDAGPQFAGEIVNYEDGLAFLTFHGAGTCIFHTHPIIHSHQGIHFHSHFQVTWFPSSARRPRCT